MTEELKPCPFCGAAAEVYPDGNMEGHSVMCSGDGTIFEGNASCCPMCTFGFATHDEAISAWNRRATPAPAQPEPTFATCQPWDTLTAREKAPSLIEELDSASERLTRRTNDPMDGLLNEAARVIEALSRELEAGAAAPAEGAAWQPIETAPKDGRIILYWVASARFQEDDETGQLREVDVSAADFGCWKPGGVHGEGYHDPFGGIPGDQGGVTHWMPSPPPPAAPKEKP